MNLSRMQLVFLALATLAFALAFDVTYFYFITRTFLCR